MTNKPKPKLPATPTGNHPVRLSTETGEMLVFPSAAAAIAHLARNGAFNERLI
jgi:hypothetical protein